MDKANTPDEVVDVVDENDNVIGTSTKGEVNSNPSLWHREICVIIYDNQGRVLVQQRSKNKKHNPLVWTLSVAGHVPSGETYERAAHRELKEELGIGTELNVYEKQAFHLPTETQIITSYLGKFPQGETITINKNEVETYRFVSEGELEELNLKDKVEDISLADLRKFFKGEFKKFVKK